MKNFVSSLDSSQRSCHQDSCELKSIQYSKNIVEEFLRYWGPSTQDLQTTLQELKYTLYRKYFSVDVDTIYEECELEEEYHLPSVEEVF